MLSRHKARCDSLLSLSQINFVSSVTMSHNEREDISWHDTNRLGEAMNLLKPMTGERGGKRRSIFVECFGVEFELNPQRYAERYAFVCNFNIQMLPPDRETLVP